jgi:hypothetical protein
MVVRRKLPKSVRISFPAESLTHFGGLYLLQAMIRRWGLPRLRYDALRFRRWNVCYTTSEELLAVVYPILLGLGRLETTRLLQHNGVFQYLTGLRRYPDPSTRRRFLSRLAASGWTAFGGLHDRLRTRFLTRRAVIFDLDTTVLTVYGRQQKAKVGFNPRKRGRASFQPLLCFEGHSGICWAGAWLAGDAHPLPRTAGLLQRAWAKLPGPGRRVSVRATPAFYDQKFLAFLEEKRAFYVVAARLPGELKHRLEGLRYRRYRSGLAAAALAYRPSPWHQARRFVIIGRPLAEEPSRQRHLFRWRGYSYETLVTNLPLLPISVWKFYHGRSTAELLIRELKAGCAGGKIPRRDWFANLAYFHLVLLAYNLLLWFKELYLPRALKGISIQRVRHRFLWVPALLVYPQGTPTLRLPRSYPYQAQFLQILRRIERRCIGVCSHPTLDHSTPTSKPHHVCPKKRA